MKKVKLTEAQMIIGAKYLTVTNFGMENNFPNGLKEQYSISEVERAFEQTANDFYGETGDESAMDEEYQSWLKEIKKGDKYCLKTIKSEIKF